MSVDGCFSSPGSREPLRFSRAVLAIAKRAAIQPASEADEASARQLADFVEEAIRVLSQDSQVDAKPLTTILEWIQHLETLNIFLNIGGRVSERQVINLWEALPESLRRALRIDSSKVRSVMLTVNKKGNNRLEELLEFLYTQRESIDDEAELVALMESYKPGEFDVPCFSSLDVRRATCMMVAAFPGRGIEMLKKMSNKIPDEKLRVFIINCFLNECRDEALMDDIFHNLQSYGITTREARMMFVEAASMSSVKKLAQHLDKFKDLGQEFFMILVKDRYLSELLMDIKTDDQEVRVGIAKAAADKFPSDLCETIVRYGIKNEEDRMAIARVVVERGGIRALCPHIKLFNITDRGFLRDIAIQAVEAGSCKLVSCRLTDFGLRDDQEFINYLAERLAKEDPLTLIKEIKNFQIRDQQFLIKLAKLVCNSNKDFFRRVCVSIEFGLDLKAKMELGMWLAESDPVLVFHEVSYMFIGGEEYLLNQAVLLKIATLAAQKDPRVVLRTSCCLLTETSRDTITAICCLQIFREDFEFVAVFVEECREELIIDFLRHKETDDAFNKLLLKKGVSALFENLEKPGEINAFVSFFCMILLKDLAQDDALAAVCVEILNFRNPRLKCYCGLLLNNLFSTGRIGEYKKIVESPRLHLPMLFLTSWGSEQVPASLSSKNKLWKDDVKLGTLLSVLAVLHDEKALSNQDRLSVISAYNSELDGYITGLKLLEMLCSIGSFSEGLPADYCVKLDLDALQKQFMEYVTRIFGVPITHEEYERLNTRIPHAVAAYASRMRSVPVVYAELQECLRWQISGEFKTKRYLSERSLHLTRLAEDYPEILAKWQKSLEAVPVLEKTSDDEGSFSFPDFCRQKLITDNHFPDIQTSCPHFHKWLLDRSYPIPNPLTNKMEVILFTLCEDQTDMDVRIQVLRDLEEEVPKSVEFANDVEMLIRSLTTVKAVSLVEVVNLDSFEDLVLAGSEVEGSCQRVDGVPEYNKCLLAYVMDGKNRMLAVRSTDTKKVRARCMLRLLFDQDGNPALFEDRFYPTVCSQAFKDALRRQAIAEARRMGIPLYTTNPGGVEGPFSTRSLGSNCSFENVDAAGGVTNGTFEIKPVFKVML